MLINAVFYAMQEVCDAYSVYMFYLAIELIIHNMREIFESECQAISM
jgi:hypothetical protein